MPCNPNDNTINVTPGPPIPVPGFGIPFSPPQIPLPSFNLPTPLLEDIPALVAALVALFPSGTFTPNPDFGMKTVLDFIANVLSQIAPFMSMYKFITAILKMITCIIEVLCAIPNPFALAIKLEILFTQCLPLFLALFPFLALLMMIIALLLLIIALIEYIINTIIAIIELLIQNILNLVTAIELQDVLAILAITQKIANLLCFIQNIMAILVAIAAILAIIEALSLLAGFTICGSDSQCCQPNICPPFIQNTPNGIPVTNGKLVYFKEVNPDVATILSLPPEIAALLNLAAIRQETWQLVDNSFIPQYPITSIITPAADGYTNIFWPNPLTFVANTTPTSAPYTVDLTVTLDPSTFGIPDTNGPRQFHINKCIVVSEPYIGLTTFNNALDLSNFTGTLNVQGGLVFEADNKTPFKISGKQATLNNFIHQTPSKASTLPSIDDSVVFNDIQFTWFPNQPALAGYNLTTIGCIPSVAVEKAVQNAVIVAEGIEPAAVKLNAPLPDINAAQQCVNTALAAFRKNITESTAATFQATVVSCLTTLQTQATTALCAAIIAAVSQFKSTVAVDTDIQFTTRQINVNVVLKDPSGTSVSNNIPPTCAGDIAENLVGNVTLGSITPFTYDGYTSFNATITSPDAGDGELSVSFNGKVFSTLVSGDGTTNNSSIIENLIGYQFINATVNPPVRRDETDVADSSKGV
jgi:hypothetical protein